MKLLTGNAGMTLLEVIGAVALIAILAGISVQSVRNNQNSEKYEQTRVKMEAIRTAIFGDAALDAKGQKIHFGYFGDMGTLPVTLTSLTTRGAQTAWSFDTQFGIGAGWRGPYFNDQYTTSQAVDTDAWGTAFSYTTTGTPTLTSFGSDGASGLTVGDVYSKDLSMTFDSALRLSSVRGFVRDGDARVPNATVEIRYPSAGALTAVYNTSASDGSFTFNTVPPTYAVITVTSVPITGSVALGPRQIAIAGPQFLVPNYLMNYYGSKQKVAIGTITSGSGNVDIPLSSSYEANQNVDRITAYWTGGPTAFLNFIKMGAAAAVDVSTGGPTCLSSGTRTASVASGQTINANTTATTFELQFKSVAAGCTGTPGSWAGAVFYINIEWKESKETDAISFTVP